MGLSLLGLELFLSYTRDVSTVHPKFFQVCKVADGYGSIVIFIGRFELYVSRTRKAPKSGAGVSES